MRKKWNGKIEPAGVEKTLVLRNGKGAKTGQKAKKWGGKSGFLK